MSEYEVIIPDELLQVITFKQEEMPGVAVINIALREFEPKRVFSWHLSMMIDFKHMIDNGMPSMEEREIIDAFENELNINIKGLDDKKPNAIFLGRITWNKTSELIWRVYNAEIVNEYLHKIIKENSSPRGFDYRMDPDKDWELAKWHLMKR